MRHSTKLVFNSFNSMHENTQKQSLLWNCLHSQTMLDFLIPPPTFFMFFFSWDFRRFLTAKGMFGSMIQDGVKWYEIIVQSDFEKQMLWNILLHSTPPKHIVLLCQSNEPYVSTIILRVFLESFERTSLSRCFNAYFSTMLLFVHTFQKAE